MTTRRSFLKTSLAAGVSLGVSRSVAAIDPIDRPGKPLMKLSLAAYSFNRFMSLKGKTKPTMTLDDFVDFAAGIGLEAVEPTSYYFAETTPEYLTRFRGKCTRLGLDVSGTAIGNDFCKADPAALKKEIESVKQWIENAALIGAKTIRIFAGTVGKGEAEDQALSRCVDAIQEVCDFAGKRGIYLALENHGGITATPAQILAIVKAVKHDWFGVNLDTGNFHGDDPYAELEQLAPYAVVVQYKTEITRKGKKKEDADPKRVLDILRGVNYRGYFVLEYEAADDPRTAVPKVIEQLRKAL